MKLKLIFICIVTALLAFVAYQKYSEYSALKSIDSYEACVSSDSSFVQDVYPKSCVTKLGSVFTNNTENTPISERVVPNQENQPVIKSTKYKDITISINNTSNIVTSYGEGCYSTRIYTSNMEGKLDYPYSEQEFTPEIVEKLFNLNNGTSLVLEFPNWREERFTFKETYTKSGIANFNNMQWTQIEYKDNWESVVSTTLFLSRTNGRTVLAQVMGDRLCLLDTDKEMQSKKSQPAEVISTLYLSL